MNTQNSPRRVKATVGPLAINQLHYTNPWVIACWSFFFPGFGHIMLGQYILGFLLFLWELFINVHAGFNLAIVYSLTGRFHEAVHVLRNHWILLYGAVFVFSFWSSYQMAIQTNQLFYLANRENAKIKIFEMNALQYDFIDKRNPWTSALWSLLSPGLGEIYNRKLPQAVFTMIWWVVICYKSHVLHALEASFTGHFQEVKRILDVEWFLFLPSIYGFAFYNAYSTTIDRNTLFEKELANFLTTKYQSNTFTFPSIR